MTITSALTPQAPSESTVPAMNWFRSLRQRKAAKKILNEAGYDGNVVKAATAAVKQVENLTVALLAAKDVIEQQDALIHKKEEKPLKTYFMSYMFEYSKHPNGGQILSGYSNTMIHVPDGIRNFRRINSIQQFIVERDFPADRFPNARVVIMGISEIDHKDGDEPATTPRPEPATPGR
jgi:hypothetical protein